MPPFPPHAARNEQGGAADFWEGYMRAYWDRIKANAELQDSMSVSFGGAEATGPPRGLRYWDDAHVAGSISVGEHVAIVG